MLKSGLHNLGLFPLFVALSFFLSSVTFGPMSVLAQESSQGVISRIPILQLLWCNIRVFQTSQIKRVTPSACNSKYN